MAHDFEVKSLLPSQGWQCGRHAGLASRGRLEMSRGHSEGMKQVSAAGDALVWATERLVEE